jgi:uncharacterized membrane protein
MGNMKKNSRIAEIDALRGLAVIAMVFYHLIYDLFEFYKYPLAMDHPMMRIASFAAPLFFILAGVSSQFSRNPWKQILKLTLAALLITIVTYLQNPTFFVKFGTLHFLACSMILLVPLKKTPNYTIIIAMLFVIGLGSLIVHQSTSFSWLFPFGLNQPSFRSSDYYPLIPYFVYPLLGVLLARFFYPDKKSLLPSLHLPLLQWMGRYSLWIYLLHQPILLFVLYLWHLL